MSMMEPLPLVGVSAPTTAGRSMSRIFASRPGRRQRYGLMIVYCSAFVVTLPIMLVPYLILAALLGVGRFNDTKFMLERSVRLYEARRAREAMAA